MKDEVKRIINNNKINTTNEQQFIDDLFILFGVSDSTHSLIYFEKERFADHKPFIVKKGYSNAQVLRIIQDLHGEIFRWWYCH